MTATVVGGLLAGLVIALRKEHADRVMAVKQRKRDYYLARADGLKRLIATMAGLLSVAKAARWCERNQRSNIEEIAERAKVGRGRNLDEFDRLSDEAYIEAERYGLLPHWSGMGTLRLGSFVDAVIAGRLYFACDDSIGNYSHGDAYGHVRALIEDLRSLAEAEEQCAQIVFLDERGTKMVRPELPYLQCLRPYFEDSKVNLKKLDTSFLESHE